MTDSLDLLQSWGLSADEAATLLSQLEEREEPSACYRRLQQEWLKPDQSFAFHRWLYESVYGAGSLLADPQPAWFPDDDTIRRSHVTRWCQRLDLEDVAALHRWSVEQRESFWGDVVQYLQIAFAHPPEGVWNCVHGPESPVFFPGGRVNIARSCLQGNMTRTAVVYEDEAGDHAQWTLEQLRDRVQLVAGALERRGLKPGFRAAVMMPMTAESVAIYLGVIWAGGAVVAIADSFAAPEVRTRLEITNADLLFVQHSFLRGGKEVCLYDRVLASEPPPCVVVGEGQPKRPQDQGWSKWLSAAGPRQRPVPCDPMAATNYLFSSGTTGVPKTIPWSHATPIKCAADAMFHQDVHAGDTLAWPTNLGWMMGPWLIYASLLNGASMALYGGSPATRGFADFVARRRVTMLGVVPSLVRAWREHHVLEGVDWTGIRALSSTGECSQAEDMLYLMSRAGYRPVIEYCGGTELAGGYISSTIVEPNAPSVFTGPTMGTEMVILDEEGRESDIGEVYLVPPSFGFSTTLLNRDHHDAYYADVPCVSTYPVLRRHGDLVERLGDRRYRVLGRADDTMNLGGIKVSSAEIERVVATMEGVNDVAAVAVPPPGGGPSELIVFVVPQRPIDEWSEHDRAELEAAIRDAIKQQLNPLFKLSRLKLVSSLPRTASNKVMRRKLRQEARE